MPKRTLVPARSATEDNVRTGLSASELKQAMLDHMIYSLARPIALAEPQDYFHALSLAVRDRMQHRWMDTTQTYFSTGQKMACYLSAEFLMGPHLGNNLVNLDIEQAARAALAELGQDFNAVLNCEEEPGLGNGGLGRLAACYLDSLASLQRPAIGYGIRYEFGIFDQEIHDGWQTEVTDKWLQRGNPWEIAKPHIAHLVNWGGHTEHYTDTYGIHQVRWVPARVVRGLAYDTPIQGYAVHTCNTLRLWSAEAVDDFDFQAFNTGDYYQAVADKVISETVTKVLYPNDEPEVGKRLRLAQQYFFVSCSLQDMLRILALRGEPVTQFAEHFAVQLNDTHPSIGVAELMRLLLDEHNLEWVQAWDITVATFGYTNHTLLPEALETWPLPMFAELLPRHLEIIYEINRLFLEEVSTRFPEDVERIQRMSLIGEEGGRYVRMANLASVGSHAINGVAALHTELLKSSVLKDFYELWPEKFSNKTNGVTPRRFLALSNPGLRALLSRHLSKAWLTNMPLLRQIEPLTNDADFRQEWRAIKEHNKQVLADYIKQRTGVVLDPTWMFDVQVKRIHEYKRQHLNVLHIITHYLRLKANPHLKAPPRAFIFGGKAAPGYYMAKRIIKLINAVAETINNDPAVNTRMKVVFVPNFNVKNAHLIYPAADLSEQISTAGKEASGTGNMKFMMNGALTIGTLDGANIEIREEAGEENFFLFGLTAAEVSQLKHDGYRPHEIIEHNAELRAVLDLICSGHFSHGEKDIFRPIVENLSWSDPFLVLADYASFIACQERVDEAWLDTEHWTRMSILNTARSGKFSSDRAIAEYCDEIWGINPLVIQP